MEKSIAYRPEKPALKNNPTWQSAVDALHTLKIESRETTEKPTVELFARLNEMAKGFPFCIMYKTKINDPL